MLLSISDVQNLHECKNSVHQDYICLGTHCRSPLIQVTGGIMKKCMPLCVSSAKASAAMFHLLIRPIGTS